MTECLSCSDLETKICDLSEQIAAADGCSGVVMSDDVAKLDTTPQLKAKIEALKSYRELYRMRCSGARELYEFVSTPCTTRPNCGPECTPIRKTRRRYR